MERDKNRRVIDVKKVGDMLLRRGDGARLVYDTEKEDVVDSRTGKSVSREVDNETQKS